MWITSTFGKYNRVCNSGNESGSLRFRSPTGICSEKYRSSASLYERKRVLCCFSGKIRKTKSKNISIGLLTGNSYIHT